MIQQGTLNRLRASVNVINSPELNVIASFTGKEGITIDIQGESTTYIPTMVGGVTSGEPYQTVKVEINLLKTQSLSNVYKQRIQDLAQIGDFVVTPDAAPLDTYYINNGSIESVKPLKLNGTDAGFVVTLTGYYQINNSLWNV
jgi:hypothetical protein